MAEETKNTSSEENTTEQKKPEGNGNEPTVEQLMEELAKERAEKERFKNANDRLSKSEAEMKRKLRATQTAEEQKKEEELEAQRIAEEEREAMRVELNHMKAVAAYKNIEDTNTVDMLIESVSECDHAGIAAIIKNEVDRAVKDAVKNAKAEWQKTMPQASYGGDEDQSVSLDAFKRMGYTARVELKRKSPELFRKLSEMEE